MWPKCKKIGGGRLPGFKILITFAYWKGIGENRVFAPREVKLRILAGVYKWNPAPTSTPTFFYRKVVNCMIIN